MAKNIINKSVCAGFLLCYFILFGCSHNNSSNSGALTNNQNANFDNLVHNKGSMTKELVGLHQHFRVQLLKDGVLDNHYVRISSLQLQNTPVITALVSTKLSNKTFVNILKNASTTPIGKMLFDREANIHRSNKMEIKTITVKDIQNSIIHKYLNKLGYSDSAPIVMRKSQFLHKDEVLNIIEYILPSMHKFVS